MSLFVRTNEPVDQAPVNRAAEVYERLRQAIVEGSIRPKERLIESELAERVTCQPHTGSRSHVALGGRRPDCQRSTRVGRPGTLG